MRVSNNLNKTSTAKFERFLKIHSITDTEWIAKFKKVLLNDIKNQKECSEKFVTEYFLNEAYNLINEGHALDDEFFDIIKVRARQKLAQKYVAQKTFDNTIDIYFNEVKREYILHPQNESDSLEFLPENRDIFIKNNLKLVIECAKRYRGLGMAFEDLIQIGNVGLLTAFEKFDTERANLRFAIIKDIDEDEADSFDAMTAEEIIKRNFTYSKTLDVTLKKLPQDGFISKQEFKDWVMSNVKTAVFASVAFKWIRAYILLEITKYGNVIKIPKSVKDDEEQSTTIIRLDSVNPHTDDCYHDNQISEIANDEFAIEDEAIENMEKKEILREIVNRCLYKLSALDKRIICKRFGVDCDYQLSINEIAEHEGISANKVKYSLTQSMKAIAENISAQDREILKDLL